MKISKREMILGAAAAAVVLFAVTYWMAGSKIAEQRRITEEKTRLLRQIQLHKRILEERDGWNSRLTELQDQLPVYSEKTAVTAELLKLIKRTADDHGLDLLHTQPYREEPLGALYELGVSCKWEGKLESLVRFLYDLQSQGLRFDVRQISAIPDARRESVLTGLMVIECAYRREAEASP